MPPCSTGACASRMPARAGEIFELRLEGGERVWSRTVLVATGVVDTPPPLEGLAPLWGRSVHHCPYCDGWEYRDSPIVAYGPGEPGARLALKLRQRAPLSRVRGRPGGDRR